MDQRTLMKRLSEVKQDLHRVATITVGLTAIVLVSAGLAAPQQTNLTAWPMLGHDPAHSGRSQHSAAANSGVVKWKFRPQGTPHRFSIPTIGANGIIYVASEDRDTHSSHLYAVSPDGTQLWASHIAGRLITE